MLRNVVRTAEVFPTVDSGSVRSNVTLYDLLSS